MLKFYKLIIWRRVALAILPGIIVAGFWGFASSTPKTVIDPLLPGKMIVDTTLPTKAIATGESIFASPEDWLTGWSYRKLITIDEAKVDNDLINFPVLVYLDSTTNFDFSEASSTGADIRFTDSGGITTLSYERENHNATSANYWVKVPLVSSTASTTIYMYYGNSVASDTASSTAVWDANFKGVWHMADGASASITYDSTSNDNDATKKAANEPIEEAGKIGNSQLFDGTDDYGKITNVVIADPEKLTISGWIKHGTGGSTYETAFHQGTSYTIGSSSYWFGVCVSDYLTATIGANVSGIGWDKGKTAIKATVGQWYFIAAVWDDSVVKVYVDGDYADKQYNLVSYNNGTTPTRFGSSIDTTGNYKFGGSIDEVRISIADKSAAWIKADYNSGNNSLLTYGSEEEL